MEPPDEDLAGACDDMNDLAWQKGKTRAVVTIVTVEGTRATRNDPGKTIIIAPRPFGSEVGGAQFPLAATTPATGRPV
ncbi:MAG: hypothetical protein ACK6D3_07160 [Planctomycetaceae bacterium]